MISIVWFASGLVGLVKLTLSMIELLWRWARYVFLSSSSSFYGLDPFGNYIPSAVLLCIFLSSSWLPWALYLKMLKLWLRSLPLATSFSFVGLLVTARLFDQPSAGLLWSNTFLSNLSRFSDFSLNAWVPGSCLSILPTYSYSALRPRTEL